MHTVSFRLEENLEQEIEEYAQEIDELVGWRRFFVKLVKPIARFWVLKKSPYYRKRKLK